MAYTDEELAAISQISYSQTEDALEKVNKIGGIPCTLSELYGEVNTTLCNTKALEQHVTNPQGGGFDPAVDTGVNLSDWNVVDYYDSNDKTGFFGMVLQDPDTGDLVVVFRGSEGAGPTDNFADNLRHDWTEADVGLMCTTQTRQQAEAEKFLQQIAASDYYKEGGNIIFTGHSLGGNLAQHAIVTAAKNGISLDRILECRTYDSPGFSDEYIKEHMAEIAMIAGRTKRFQWSGVGHLLEPLPGTTDVPVMIQQSDSLFYNIIGKHGLENLSFDSNGSLVPTQVGALEISFRDISRAFDHLPFKSGHLFAIQLVGCLEIVGWVAEHMVDSDGDLTFMGRHIISAGITALVMVAGLIVIAPTTLGLIVSLLIISVLAALALARSLEVYERLYQKLHQLGDWLVSELQAVYKWTDAQLQQIRKDIADMLQRLLQWSQGLVVQAGATVAIGAQIIVDTDTMRGYANRLEQLRRHLEDIDTDLKRLYQQTQEQALKPYQWGSQIQEERLKKCAEWLKVTAQAFDDIERELASV